MRPEGSSFDAIVVLGARLDEDGAPSPAMARRTARGIALFEAGLAPLLILSGGATAAGAVSEAEAMRRLALEAGVPGASMLLETASRSTWENATMTRRLMSERGLRSGLLVSDRLHLPRALLCFRRVGIQVEGRAAEAGWGASPPSRLVGQVLYETVALLRYLPRLLLPGSR